MAKRKIHLGPADGSAKALYVEGLAVDAFLPGTLLKQTASGLETSDIADSAFNSECIVAKEISESEGGLITTAYTVGDTAAGVVVRSGEFANVRVAASQNITTKGTALASNGDGTLKIAATDGTDQVLFYSDEIVNTGGSVALVTVRKA
jgi:hypothetical protein